MYVVALWTVVEGGITDNRIVGGRPAKEGEFPYQVSDRQSRNVLAAEIFVGFFDAVV